MRIAMFWKVRWGEKGPEEDGRVVFDVSKFVGAQEDAEHPGHVRVFILPDAGPSFLTRGDVLTVLKTLQMAV